MAPKTIVAAIEQQDWIEPGLQKSAELVKNAFAAAGPAGQAAKNALHGVWLGHPLHPVITDVPIGSWTVAAALDLLEIRGDAQYQTGADFAILLGLVASVPTALSGVTDWSDTHGKPQRVGAVHGILNLSAAILYAGSCVARKSRRRGLAQALSFLGYGLVLASAYLGGELSYAQKIGVNHAPDPEGELPKDFTEALAESDLIEGQPQKVTIDGTDILIVKIASRIYAMAEKCSHLGGPLSEGKVVEDSLICPWHASRFCLRDGHVEAGPATVAQPVLDIKLDNGKVLVRAQQD
jgi:nitrite reductase/ring-hydroxylating ferredoxin subunit/uncharacterized membrane protein